MSQFWSLMILSGLCEALENITSSNTYYRKHSAHAKWLKVSYKLHDPEVCFSRPILHLSVLLSPITVEAIHT